MKRKSLRFAYEFARPSPSILILDFCSFEQNRPFFLPWYDSLALASSISVAVQSWNDNFPRNQNLARQNNRKTLPWKVAGGSLRLSGNGIKRRIFPDQFHNASCPIASNFQVFRYHVPRDPFWWWMNNNDVSRDCRVEMIDRSKSILDLLAFIYSFTIPEAVLQVG